jgi:hypothetical protein
VSAEANWVLFKKSIVLRAERWERVGRLSGSNILPAGYAGVREKSPAEPNDVVTVAFGELEVR